MAEAPARAFKLLRRTYYLGRARLAKFKESDADPEELKKGIAHESAEHGFDEETAKWVVCDHLVEDALYYTHLAEMESKRKEPADGGARD